jgi:hypothetical protein
MASRSTAGCLFVATDGASFNATTPLGFSHELETGAIFRWWIHDSELKMAWMDFQVEKSCKSQTSEPTGKD